MFSLRSYTILKHQIMIWVYFLIGLKVDWLSNSKHPLFFFFYLKIQPGEPLPFLNCVANWLRESYHIQPWREGSLFCSGRGSGDGMESQLSPEPSFSRASRPAMHTSASMPRSPFWRHQLRTPICDCWLLFWPPPPEKCWGRELPTD